MQELLSKIEELNLTPEKYFTEGETSYGEEGEYDLAKLKEVLGDFETVVEEGGEGQGESYYIVVYFPKYNTYLRANGWYASYDGTHFEDAEWKVVTKQEKTITVYE